MFKWIKKHLFAIVLCFVFLIGIGVLLYPSVSMWWNARIQSRVVATYDDAMADLSERDYSEYLEAAREYNERLYQNGSLSSFSNPDSVEGYFDTLNVSGDNVMGYITIDKINVRLPIYHGTSESALSSGAGHLQGSSLPVGGESTHTVISAHRGLPNARMFTDLDKIEIGDTFELHVLGDTLTYEVDQIVVVLPEEMEELYIKKGEDYCTLVTCTPYGINTHRLLVRGHRVPNIVSVDEGILTADDASQNTGFSMRTRFLMAVAAAVIFVFAASEIITVILKRRDKKKRLKEESENEEKDFEENRKKEETNDRI